MSDYVSLLFFLLIEPIFFFFDYIPALKKKERRNKIMKRHWCVLVYCCQPLVPISLFLPLTFLFLQLKMKREFERRSSEPVHKELERLWLLN